MSNCRLFHQPKDKVDVEEELPAEGVAPAAEEEGADDREQVVHDALVYLSQKNEIQYHIFLRFFSHLHGSQALSKFQLRLQPRQQRFQPAPASRNTAAGNDIRVDETNK